MHHQWTVHPHSGVGPALDFVARQDPDAGFGSRVLAPVEALGLVDHDLGDQRDWEGRDDLEHDRLDAAGVGPTVQQPGSEDGGVGEAARLDRLLCLMTKVGKWMHERSSTGTFDKVVGKGQKMMHMAA